MKRQGDAQRIKTPLGLFDSLTAAAKAYGLTPPAIHRRLRDNIQGFEYIDRDPYPIIVKRHYKKHRGHTVTYNGIMYESIRAAAKANNLSDAGMRYRLKLDNA